MDDEICYIATLFYLKTRNIIISFKKSKAIHI